MATLTLTITSGAGTDSKVLNFSAGDATRIINAFRNNMHQPAGTQADFLDWLAPMVTSNLKALVRSAETTTPADPNIT